MKTLFKIIGCLIGLLVILVAAASFHPEVQNVFRALRPSTGGALAAKSQSPQYQRFLESAVEWAGQLRDVASGM